MDEGVSARKSPAKRPELQRLLNDIAGKQIALTAFTRLDRWTRNIKGYYQVQDVLDRHKVAWIAIQEDYETITASGRFKVNIMLSVAENEADRTSERIKAVFEHKVDMGQAITRSLPLGLKIENKHVVPDENAEAARAVFEHYAAHGNKQAARDMLHEKYGICLPHLTITHMLQNPLYVGRYRDNPQFCDAIVSRELFERVQDDLSRRATRKTPSGRVYLFSGLLICKECGRRLGVCTSGGKKTPRYRCAGHYMLKDCEHAISTRENVIEEYLLMRIAKNVSGWKAEYNSAENRKPAVNRKNIEAKLERLKELYIDGDISKEKYRTERDKLSEKLKEETRPKQIEAIKLAGDNFRKDYAALTREQKKTLWRSVLDHIEINNSGQMFIFFR